MEMRCDVVIVGAGAAGLAAARVLSTRGASAVVLEARDRIGGRLLTREDAVLPVPFDLGGEFVHGTAEASFALLRAADTVAIDTGDGAFAFENGELREREDPFETVAHAMTRPRAARGREPRGLSCARCPTDRARAAAPVRAHDGRGIRRGRSGREHARDRRRVERRADGQTAEQFRPLGGYARLMRALMGGSTRRACMSGSRRRSTRCNATRTACARTRRRRPASA